MYRKAQFFSCCIICSNSNVDELFFPVAFRFALGIDPFIALPVFGVTPVPLLLAVFFNPFVALPVGGTGFPA